MDKGPSCRREPDKAEHEAVAENRLLLKYLGEAEQDFPIGKVSERVFVWEDRLETVLARDWPAWEMTRLELIESGRGVEGRNGKHAATYALAAEECRVSPAGPSLKLSKRLTLSSPNPPTPTLPRPQRLDRA